MIGEQGDVVKITEAMIKRACVELKARCHVPKQSKR
ncbi:PA1571 family protein [Rhizobium hidalgonense]